MKGAFRFPLYTGGTPDPAVFCPANGYEPLPDPAVFCPAEGYILDEPYASKWELILSFTTNKSGTFNPRIVSTYADRFCWRINGVNYYTLQPSLSLDGSERTIELWRHESAANITGLYFYSQGIIGALDISNTAFSPVTIYQLHNNPGLTNTVFPTSSVSISTLWAYNCNLTGTLDLSMLSTFSTNANIQFHLNSLLTGVAFASSITGRFGTLFFHACNLTGTLDLSAWTAIASTTYIQLHDNPNLTGVSFPASLATTGQLRRLRIDETGITGTLDISVFTYWYSGAELRFNDCPNLTGITFASTINSGYIVTLWGNNSGVTSLDFSSIGVGGVVYCSGNSSLASITFKSSNPEISILLLSGSALTSIDFSNHLFSNGCNFQVSGNSSLTTLIFGSSLLNSFLWFYIHSNSLNYTSPLFASNMANQNDSRISIANNSWTAAMINQFLYEFDSIAIGGYSSRSLDCSGSNAAPDSSSGGYDGLAAKTSLQGKGFTVTTN